MKTETADKIKTCLEYLRGELRAERISFGELHELQSLAPHIAPGDVELLEAAGVPEFPQPANWTPGPYHVEKHNGRYEIWPNPRDEAHTYVAVAQTKVDAELLALAPELVELFQTAISALDLDAPESLALALDEARAVLAKIGGEK